MWKNHLIWLALPLASAACRCAPADDPASEKAAGERPAVVSFTGGAISREELQRAANRLPATLRERYAEHESARVELARALADKKLLVVEARRRGLADEEDIAAQVRALEERLIVQALLEREEASSPPVGDEEARAWFEANRSLLYRPDRVQVRRILFPWGTRDRWDDVLAEAERTRRRLLAGESAVELAKLGKGPERMNEGDLGYRTRNQMPNGLAEPAFALSRVGEVSEVIETNEGAALLVLIDRKSQRDPTFEEARAEILSRLEPERKRRALDALLERLRREAGVQVDRAALQ